mmetsp:Transcript_55480/g.118210  ORF Transcript_55480/g.118210 Transcript_55480/m.118210 type:complete len:232 (-) Transcript_55480:170-865(-)
MRDVGFLVGAVAVERLAGRRLGAARGGPRFNSVGAEIVAGSGSVEGLLLRRGGSLVGLSSLDLVRDVVREVGGVAQERLGLRGRSPSRGASGIDGVGLVVRARRGTLKRQRIPSRVGRRALARLDSMRLVGVVVRGHGRGLRVLVPTGHNNNVLVAEAIDMAVVLDVLLAVVVEVHTGHTEAGRIVVEIGHAPRHRHCDAAASVSLDRRNGGTGGEGTSSIFALLQCGRRG